MFHKLRLGDSTWAYMSVILDQATKEVLAASVSQSSNKLLIMDTLSQLEDNLPNNFNPIIHSDQGWHYQLDRLLSWKDWFIRFNSKYVSQGKLPR